MPISRISFLKTTYSQTLYDPLVNQLSNKKKKSMLGSQNIGDDIIGF